MSILIQNATVVTLGEVNRVLKNHSVLVEGSTIKRILPDKEAQTLKAAKKINAHGKILMPGWINAHMHYYSSFARGLGKAAPSKNFPEILNNLWWRLDKKLSLEDCYYSTMVANILAIKHGTTTLIDHHASPFAARGSLNEVAKAVIDTGLRASLCYELSDRDGEEIAQDGIDENLDFIKQKKSSQLHAMFGMHASFTISDKTLKKACELAHANRAGIHIHCAEDISDQNETIKMCGKRVVERLHDVGALGKNSICAHAIHISEKEMDLLSKSETMVVHNPQSNMNNSVGVANIFELLKRNILVGLGTDAMTTNMLEELRASMWVHHLNSKDPSVGFMETTGLLVHGNRKITKRLFGEMGIGEVKEGGVADIILVDYHTPTEFSDETFLGHLVFGISQERVDTTIASGKVLMEDKKLTMIDEESVMAKALECSKKLWSRF